MRLASISIVGMFPGIWGTFVSDLENATCFGSFLDAYERDFVDAPGNLSASTRAKYKQHLRKHIRPEFAGMEMDQIKTRVIDAWLARKAGDGLSWSTRMDLRNLLSGIFTTAARWGEWEKPNPAEHANVGRKKLVREKRKLSIDETRRLLSALPDDVRLIVMTALFCTLRISEILALRWKHVDFGAGVLRVRQRYYRGDVDDTKSERSTRDVPMGYLAGELVKRRPLEARPEDFVFSVKTRFGVTREDRSINQHFLRPAAKDLGIYWKGFGFHAFRREAVTGIAAKAGAIQAMRAAGHSKMDMTLLYGLEDHEEQAAAIRQMQERIGIGQERQLLLLLPGGRVQ